MRTNKILISLVFVLFLINFVSSAPPVTQVQSFTTGYVIQSAPTEVIKQNTDYTFNFFLYNISNGMPVGRNAINCTLYLADNQGNLLFNGNPLFSNGYYSIKLTGGNFTSLGHHPYGIACNSSTLGAADVNYFDVTPNGNVVSTSESITMLWQVLVLIIVALTFIFFGYIFKIDSVKIFFFILAGLTLFLLVGMALSLSQSQLGLYNQYVNSYSAYYVIFAILGGTAIIGLVVWFIYTIFSKFSNVKIGKLDNDDID